MKVISNNPVVLEQIEDNHRVKGDPVSVLREVRKYLESGYSLVSMPLPANQRLLMSPYRSIVVDNSSVDKDMMGLVLLEKAIERYGSRTFCEDPKADKDFALIDLEQVLVTFQSV